MPFVKSHHKALLWNFYILFSAFFFLSFSGHGQYYFNSRCQEAYQEILNFRFGNAQRLLDEELHDHPDNLVPLYFENYIDFFKLFTGENRLMFEILKNNKATRIELLEKGNESSPYYRFFLAGVTLQWAFIRLKFGEYTTAAFEIRRAFLLLNENKNLFPDFLPNEIGLGILHIIVSLVPDNYKWLVTLAGLEGTLSEGVTELEKAVGYSGTNPIYTLFKPEACFYLAFVEVNLRNNKQASLELIKRFDHDTSLQRFRKSPLIIYAKSNIFMKNGQNDAAIDLLDTYKGSSSHYPLVYLKYLKGLARLNKLDTLARPSLEVFLKEFSGINYIKSAYQKLAWTYLLQGDTNRYFQVIEQIGDKGYAIVDEDKQAYSEFNVGIIPALPLLKARLLFDGGYYRESLDILLSTPLESYIRSRKDLAEYTYRMGRIYHEMGNIPKAIQYYSLAIQNGRRLPHYYAASAALNLGIIYEDSGDYEGADSNYRLCMSLKHDEYENSLRQKAKAGLNRLKKTNP